MLRLRQATGPSRHVQTLRRLRPLHRLFQVSLGILGGQHPDVAEACGDPVRWSGVHRMGGGIGFMGPRATWSVVPTLDGAWSPSHAPAPVVRALDETIDAMCRTAADALASAKSGREGNQVARGFFYMQRGLTEGQFVRQYVEFLNGPARPPPLTDLLGEGLRD